MQDTQVIHGDCLEAMRGMDAASVDAIVTDPPYGLSFMGKHWDHGVPGVDFWVEALRVAKPGTHLLAFGGTRTYHRLACAIEDAGWEVRDCIAWLYGSGFPKSHNLHGQWSGWGTALKPAFEPIIVARKPLIGTVAENVTTHGTGAINVDGCRVGDEVRYNAPAGNMAGGNSLNMSLVGMPQDADGRMATGRWPANLIHDGSAEVVGLFPSDTKKASGKVKVSSGRKSGCGTWAGSGMQRAGTENTGVRDFGDTGSAARFFYCAKASRRDREEGCESNSHPCVKPTSLMRYLCRLVTPPGGIVLDPFAGSGSTGKGAVLEGFNFIGIELEAEHVNIARARIEHARTELQRTA